MLGPTARQFALVKVVVVMTGTLRESKSNRTGGDRMCAMMIRKWPGRWPLRNVGVHSPNPWAGLCKLLGPWPGKPTEGTVRKIHRGHGPGRAIHIVGSLPGKQYKRCRLREPYGAWAVTSRVSTSSCTLMCIQRLRMGDRARHNPPATQAMMATSR